MVAVAVLGAAGLGGGTPSLSAFQRDAPSAPVQAARPGVDGVSGGSDQVPMGISPGRSAVTPLRSATVTASRCPNAIVPHGVSQPTFDWPLASAVTIVRPFDGPAEPWLAGHRGVDLAAPPGTPVSAPADGVVSFAGLVVDRHLIVIDHGELRSTLEPVIPAYPAGTPVSARQVVGTVSDEPSHAPDAVHWGVRRGDIYLDPTLLVCPAPKAILLE